MQQHGLVAQRHHMGGAPRDCTFEEMQRQGGAGGHLEALLRSLAEVSARGQSEARVSFELGLDVVVTRVISTARNGATAAQSRTQPVEPTRPLGGSQATLAIDLAAPVRGANDARRKGAPPSTLLGHGAGSLLHTGSRPCPPKRSAPVRSSRNLGASSAPPPQCMALVALPRPLIWRRGGRGRSSSRRTA